MFVNYLDYAKINILDTISESKDEKSYQTSRKCENLTCNYLKAISCNIQNIPKIFIWKYFKFRRDYHYHIKS